MNETLPTVYLLFLLLLLTAIAIFVIQQIFKTRKTESELSQLQKKLKNEKGTALDYFQLGSIYLNKKLFAKASQLFQRALKAEDDIEPENLAFIYNGLGYCYLSQEQYDLAIRQYKTALKHNPQFVKAINNLAYAYEKKQLTAQALETYEEALKYEPENPTAKKRTESLRKRLVTS